ncbi:PTS sugar transporter subunit IIC [Streptococcus pacificus]|uniref:Ascorbate-specific PTS system EIIC component n=1 Tax=Streptococcus pacificus TaxID=2740577 RepID=A0ABS0ZID3_9STRE|nr:PTS sugar transporter subunit IIC [Streptococcus pacificus]MBJ8325774.1 PTS sugar transporter subunit IIC [Streptococcus pacificus]
MNDFLEFSKQLLLEPAIVIGILVGIGYYLSKKGPIKIITGAISAMVGLELILFGGSMFTSTFKPIVTAVSDHYGITGYLMDPYAMRASTQEALGANFSFVGYVFLIAFFVNLILVFFGKYTKAKGIFLTGNTGIAHAQAILWLTSYWLGLNWLVTTIIAGVLLGIYWAIATTVPINAVKKVTNNGGFTIGHNQMFGIWFFSKIAGFFGNPETDDAEKLELPGWLGIFNHNVTAIALIMTVFVGGFLLSIGPSNIQELAGEQHWLIFIFYLGIKFSMYMVILLQGVRMMVGEINQSFKGIQEKVIPNAVPAVDVAALLPFSANAATLGFIFTTIGTVFSMMVLVLIKSPIMVLPGFVPLFFSGGPIGVVANKYGGYKSVIVCCFLLGIIQSFGTIWAIGLSGLPDGIGWTGMFDWSTVIPLFTELLKLIARILTLGVYA